MFVADEIRDDYKKWAHGDIIIIHAQTGAGKTYFVLQKLLPFVAEHGKNYSTFQIAQPCGIR